MAIIKKKKKKHNIVSKIVLLAKATLNRIEVSISKALNDSYIVMMHLILVNNVSEEYDDVKKEIKNLETSSVN